MGACLAECAVGRKGPHVGAALAAVGAEVAAEPPVQAASAHCWPWALEVTGLEHAGLFTRCDSMGPGC